MSARANGSARSAVPAPVPPDDPVALSSAPNATRDLVDVRCLGEVQFVNRWTGHTRTTDTDPK